MLVIVSDLHLTDGSTAINVHRTAFEMLGKEIAASAEQKRVGELHIVLLGDIYDLVRTDYWQRKPVHPEKRPWGGSALDPTTGMNADTQADVGGQFREVLENILATDSSKAFLKMLKDLPNVGGRAPRVTYVIGNHDRVFNNFAALQRRLQSEFADGQLEFTNLVQDSSHGVLARHGHEWDEDCHGWQFLTKVLKKGSQVGRFQDEAYRVMAIGEVVTAELMAGLVFHAAAELGSRNDQEDMQFLRTLMDVNNLRPMTDVLKWITWLTNQQSRKYIDVITGALRKALDGLLDCTLAKRWDDIKPDLLVSGDLTDYLSKARALLEMDGGLETLQELMPLVDKLQAALRQVKGAGDKDDLMAGAEEEFAGGTPPGIEYIVYGHTHSARNDCFAATRDGIVRMYINTGTFLPLIERALDDKSFWQGHRMTYVCFYNAEEDKEGRRDNGPTIDLWNGLRRKLYKD
jgi:UDP-2,3-diacylglucosamine pyrophosphatase LpxH